MTKQSVAMSRNRATSLASRLIRFAAREAADELLSRGFFAGAAEPSARSGGRVRIDVPDMVGQLGSSEAKQQLNHLFAWNHRWVALLSERNRRTAVDTYNFIESEMPNALFVLDQFRAVRSYRDAILELDGQILDLGVYRGGSTRALARIYPERAIHGFDSFEGLPENWSHALKGDFGDVQGVLPQVPANVTLHRGWFEDSLPVWFEQHGDTPISLLRVDCDIYSSTNTIFTVLRPLIRPGTWIVFDELIGYRGWREHEYRAFTEFVEETGFEYEFMAYGLTYAIVRLRSAGR